jgi:glycerol-3-phosphate dehydrogenase
MGRVNYDIAIIGGGVMGAALANHAMELFPNCFVAILEKNTLPGLGASGNNSGVLHSPFQQKPDSLKAKFATRGRMLASKFAKENGVGLLETGMVIAVPSSEMRHPSFWGEGAASMWKLFRRGKSHDMDFNILTGIGVKKIEPNIHAAGGVFIPSVSVIDSPQFVRALAARAQKNGAHFFYENEVKAICFNGDSTLIDTAHMNIRAKAIINAAGLYADDIANLAFRKELYRQYPWSGEYYEVINPEKKNLVSRLVYPVVSPKYPGKGIHLGPRPDGSLFLGPNARPMPSKTFDHENRSPKDEFLKIANAFGLGLEPDDLAWRGVGIRPTLSPTGEEKDFHIKVDSFYPFFLNYIGIASPGISSAMALAEYGINLIRVQNIL